MPGRKPYQQDPPRPVDAGVCQPLMREIPADLETPVSVYLKLAGDEPSFLLESVTGGERLARYSFLGFQPRRAYVLRGSQVERCEGRDRSRLQLPTGANPLDYLRAEMPPAFPANIPGLPRFSGGLVGYLSYEMIRYFEPSVNIPPHTELPDGIFLLMDTLVAFDHAYGKLLLIADASEAAGGEYAAAARLDAIEKRLAAPLAGPARDAPYVPSAEELTSNLSREAFIRGVEVAKEHIRAGDIFQVVLSQRLERQTSAGAFAIYRQLRRLNPSPYMYFFNFGTLVEEPGLQLIGASPELHVRLEGRQAAVRPIAGTRPRGKTLEEDQALEADLLVDPKERAEHVMLVDLARNDLGRVCEYGSVRVAEQMAVERYSHVMHIVSEVVGRLRPDLDAYDLVRATFPAGTVSGAPKIRAMQIISDLELDSRGPYAGIVGYFARDGSLDTCITIRTLVMRGQRVSIQAGAGIVADSDPEREYQETLNKARALAVAVDRAENAGR